MKHLFNYLLLAICVFNFSACSSDDENTNENIQVENKDQLTQTVTAEGSITSDGVSFTTTGAWSSIIKETTSTRSGDTPKWISITPDHGTVAGDYTITINLEANFTGETRTAVITIVCGDSKIEIVIKQEATTQEGKYPSKYKKVVSEIVGSIKSQSGRPQQANSYQFKYDERNRLKELYVIDGDNKAKDKYIYSYDIKGEIRVYENDDDSYTSLDLNDLGYAEKISDDYDYNTTYVTYSADGYISRIKYGDSGHKETASFMWSDGKIKSVTQKWQYDEDLSVAKPVYSSENIMNDKVNIDLNVFFWNVDCFEEYDFLLYQGPKDTGYGSLWHYAVPGFLGKQNQGYVVNVERELGELLHPASPSVREDEIPAIGTTKIFYSAKSLFATPRYNFNKDGYPISFEYEVEVEKEVKVYNGAKEPDMEGWDGHKYDIVNRGEPNEQKLYYYYLSWNTTTTTHIDTYTFVIQYKN